MEKRQQTAAKGLGLSACSPVCVGGQVATLCCLIRKRLLGKGRLEPSVLGVKGVAG